MKGNTAAGNNRRDKILSVIVLEWVYNNTALTLREIGERATDKEIPLSTSITSYHIGKLIEAGYLAKNEAKIKGVYPTPAGIEKVLTVSKFALSTGDREDLIKILKFGIPHINQVKRELPPDMRTEIEEMLKKVTGFISYFSDGFRAHENKNKQSQV